MSTIDVIKVNNVNEIMKKYDNVSSNNMTTKSWSGFKELVLVDRVNECTDIVSFYFQDKNGNSLPVHKAGQYLPFKIKCEDDKYKNQLRTYSLSMNPNDYIYRISVKKVNGGLISTYLHENLKLGDTIEAMIPTGLFTLDKSNKNKPIVFISAGIGITPLISMFYDAIKSGINNITFIEAVQNSKMQPFNNDIKALVELNPNVKSYVFYSNPIEEDKIGGNYDFEGYINKEWIKEYCPLDADFYFCGPPVFMKILNKNLLALGVDKKSIHFEFFGKPEEME